MKNVTIMSLNTVMRDVLRSEYFLTRNILTNGKKGDILYIDNNRGLENEAYL